MAKKSTQAPKVTEAPEVKEVIAEEPSTDVVESSDQEETTAKEESPVEETTDLPKEYVEVKQEGPKEGPAQEPQVETIEDVKTELTPAEEVIANAPDHLASVATLLAEYVTVMSKNYPSTVEERKTCQVRLRTVLNSVLNSSGELFDPSMKWLLNTVRTHRKNCFHEMLVFRNYPELTLGRGEVKRMESLVSLLLSAVDVKNPREVGKLVDLNVVFRYVTDNDQQQRLTAFFGDK